MNYRKYSICAIITLLLVCWLAVIPAAADFEGDFDWQVYRINTEAWEEYTDYLKYSGIIYEVHFFDDSSGNSATWNWDFGAEDDWWGSTEENPVHIYTSEEADATADNSFKVTLQVTDSSGNYDEVSHYVYVEEDSWNVDSNGNPRLIIDLTPKPTSTPTPVPTTATPVPTTATPTLTPTPEPTPVPAFTLKVPVISDEIIKLKSAYNDHLDVIIELFSKIGINLK